MNTWKDVLHYLSGSSFYRVALKIYFSIVFLINLRKSLIRFVCWLPFKMEILCKFFKLIWLLLLSWNVFCGKGFASGAGIICLRVKKKCGDGVTLVFFQRSNFFFQ